MSKGLSATQRTLRALRNEGLLCEIVEKWVTVPGHPGGGFRKDYLGFIDIIALDASKMTQDQRSGIIGVQSCGQAFSPHLRKIMDSETTNNVIEWLRCGGRLQLWGWRKLKLKRGGKAMRWKPRIQEITLSDFEL